MNYWLIKSEPSTYSYETLVKEKSTAWTGVRNYAARNNLRAMKKGDLCFFYHSNEGLCIVGIAKVVKEAYQDPTSDDPNWACVDVAPHKKFKTPVTLSELKADTSLKNMQFVKIGRLSVSVVTEAEFNKVCKLGGV
ncbi:MAG: EVE domain-containing protein [Bacteroidia bacterium]|nr:EVE domain-containing protein [Bacteroidia bacterium]